MTDPSRTWRPKFVPAHRRKRKPLHNAILAPLIKHVCDEKCTHPRRDRG